MNTPDEPLNHALNALREYLQGNLRNLADLRETSHSSGQRLEQLTADVERFRQELQGVQQNAPELDAFRQELLTTLREVDHRHDQRGDQLAAEVEALRQELLTNLRETGNARGQRLDQLAADLEAMSQRLLAALREAGDTGDQRLNRLAADLDALRRDVQDVRQNAPDLNALRQELQNIQQNAPGLDALRQELQGIRQNNSELERSLRLQLAKAREQLDAHARDLAALTERAQSQSQETGEHIQTLTGLHQQEKSQRETTLAMLSKLSERTSSLEQRIGANQAQAADALRVDQNRLAALEKWLTTQAEQFSRFDPILRELHSELVSAHQRLAALESAGVAETLDHHEQRLNETERSVHDQLNALSEMQQTLNHLAIQTPATAKLNRILIGALAATGAIMMGLLVILAAG